VVRLLESAVCVVMFAGLAACGGNQDPNAKKMTELSPAPRNSAAAHVVPDPGGAALQPAATVSAAPGFAGVWASGPAQCLDLKKTYQFSATRIEMGAERGCAVTSISEEHPSGRSLIYHVSGACIGKTASNDAIVFSFGPSDTVMQVQVNDGPPETLVRCPQH
jgi:hypothetical protein